MERISDELSEIAYALQQLASDAHMAPRPTWEQVANHIAHTRFPEDGLRLSGHAISMAVRQLILGEDPDLINQRDVSLKLSGSPDLYIFAHKSYGTPACESNESSRVKEGILPFREAYKILLIKPRDVAAHPITYPDYGEGIVLFGSPSRLHPFVLIQENTLPGGPSTLRDYPKDTLPHSVEDHRKAVVMRTLRRIGL